MVLPWLKAVFGWLTWVNYHGFPKKHPKPPWGFSSSSRRQSRRVDGTWDASGVVPKNLVMCREVREAAKNWMMKSDETMIDNMRKYHQTIISFTIIGGKSVTWDDDDDDDDDDVML